MHDIIINCYKVLSEYLDVTTRVFRWGLGGLKPTPLIEKYEENTTNWHKDGKIFCAFDGILHTFFTQAQILQTVSVPHYRLNKIMRESVHSSSYCIEIE